MEVLYSVVAGVATLSYVAAVALGYKYLKEDYDMPHKNLFYMAEAMAMDHKAF